MTTLFITGLLASLGLVVLVVSFVIQSRFEREANKSAAFELAQIEERVETLGARLSELRRIDDLLEVLHPPDDDPAGPEKKRRRRKKRRSRRRRTNR